MFQERCQIRDIDQVFGPSLLWLEAAETVM